MERKEWMNPENLNSRDGYDRIMFLKHLFPYKFIADYVTDKDVLEIGCGAGYGSKLLSATAKRITTFDRDTDSLDYAKKNNYCNNIAYVLGDISAGLPFKSKSFDIVVSFQVIEHLSNKILNIYLNEIIRVLKTGGQLYVTTPNRKVRLRFLQKPTNKFHIKEYSAKQLKRLLQQRFNLVEVTGIRSLPEIEKIEIRRSKQSFFKAYFSGPARIILLNLAKNLGVKKVIKWFENRSAKGKKSLITTSDESIHYSIEDFRVDSHNTDKSLDLMAICKK